MDIWNALLAKVSAGRGCNCNRDSWSCVDLSFRALMTGRIVFMDDSMANFFCLKFLLKRVLELKLEGMSWWDG